MRPLLSLFALSLMIGCAPLANDAPWAVLPPDAVQGAGDPTRAAISQSAFVLSHPESFTGRPGDVARAVANLEFLAVSMPTDPRFSVYGGDLPGRLAMGRDEARRSLGIAGGAEPQLVIDGFYGASRALRRGDRAAAEHALTTPTFTAGGVETLRRLGNLPSLPLASAAASHAATEMGMARSERTIR